MSPSSCGLFSSHRRTISSYGRYGAEYLMVLVSSSHSASCSLSSTQKGRVTCSSWYPSMKTSTPSSTVHTITDFGSTSSGTLMYTSTVTTNPSSGPSVALMNSTLCSILGASFRPELANAAKRIGSSRRSFWRNSSSSNSSGSRPGTYPSICATVAFASSSDGAFAFDSSDGSFDDFPFAVFPFDDFPFAPGARSGPSVFEGPFCLPLTFGACTPSFGSSSVASLYRSVAQTFFISFTGLGRSANVGSSSTAPRSSMTRFFSTRIICGGGRSPPMYLRLGSL
mmetsp:Transcript_12008/g.51698  ORF Transcript_12008/g.51698 Transcript_12008/m.51698 type:complete len:282 (+) Transcript_12008:161-1006(+)